ncbi:MAG TPA: CHAP domain-containing protein [Vicinamibacterales bacterium]|nr:CHAP domain-containing protein [Vicinamibacterales bacterium]
MAKYPGRVIKLGEADPKVIKAIKMQLNTRLNYQKVPALKLDVNDPSFDQSTRQAVKMFQALNTDERGSPLVIDGEIGPLTWGILFGQKAVKHSGNPSSILLREVLRVGRGEIGVREVPKNSNFGPRVEEYQALTATKGLAWCVSFVYWCFNTAAANMGRPNPMYKTAGVLNHWKRCESAGAARLPAHDAKDNPGLVKPGMIFVMDHGGGKGHTGLVEIVDSGFIRTIEGNTDASGANRDGGGVYEVERKISSINTGFIAY